MMDLRSIQIGQEVWTKWAGEAAAPRGGLVVDVGLNEAGDPYVIVLDLNSRHAPNSRKKRQFLYLRGDGKETSLGQVAELRRHMVALLADCDGFRSPQTMTRYASAALLAAGITMDGDEQDGFIAAAMSLLVAVGEMNETMRGDRE